MWICGGVALALALVALALGTLFCHELPIVIVPNVLEVAIGGVPQLLPLGNFSLALAFVAFALASVASVFALARVWSW